MQADLTARACGFAGVFLTLTALGLADHNDFLITPKETFSSVEMQMSIRVAGGDLPRTQEAEPQAEKTEPEPETDGAQAQDEVQSKEQAEPDGVQESPRQTSEIRHEMKQAEAHREKTVEVKRETKPEVKRETKPEVKRETKPEVKRETKPEVKQERPQQKKAASDAHKTERPKRTESARNKEKSAAAAHTQKPEPEAARQQAVMAKERLSADISGKLVSEIRKKLRYPKNAVRRKLEGIVEIDFTVTDGKISSYVISRSSGHRILDEAASKLAEKLKGFDTGAGAVSCTVTVPVKYELI